MLDAIWLWVCHLELPFVAILDYLSLIHLLVGRSFGKIFILTTAHVLKLEF